MKEKIAEVQQYFIEKIVNADFKITDGDKFKLSILIESIYEFDIWISNGMDSLQVYHSIGGSFMELPRFTIQQKEYLYGKIESEILKYTGTEFRKIELARQIAELQNQLEKLK